MPHSSEHEQQRAAAACCRIPSTLHFQPLLGMRRHCQCTHTQLHSATATHKLHRGLTSSSCLQSPSQVLLLVKHTPSVLTTTQTTPMPTFPKGEPSLVRFDPMHACPTHLSPAQMSSTHAVHIVTATPSCHNTFILCLITPDLLPHPDKPKP
jgi:hypothetical protein